MPRKSVSRKRKCRSRGFVRKCGSHKSKKGKKRHIVKRAEMMMFGYDGIAWRPVLVNQNGSIVVSPLSPAPSGVFHEETFSGVSAQNDWHPLPPQETAAQMTYSYAVINRSSNAAGVRVEISPDGVHYAVDREDTVQPGETKALVPTRFLKYTRLSVRSLPPDGTVVVDVFYQAQSIA